MELSDTQILTKVAIKYITLKEIAADWRYPFSYLQIIELMRLKKRNGLDKIARKIGTKYYLNKELFDKWVEEYEKNPHLRVHKTRGGDRP